jgi:F-type H+-transporting ATPase subunit b
MPQLDISTYTSQLFWLLLTFVPLYLIILRKALPRITEVLEARRNKIDDDLKKAATRKEEADVVRGEYEQAQAESHAKAQALLKQAQEEMAEEAAGRNEALNATLATQGLEAERHILASKEEALANLGSVVADVVSLATNKLIGETPGDDEVHRALQGVSGGRS